jgi:hypothetical protein
LDSGDGQGDEILGDGEQKHRRRQQTKRLGTGVMGESCRRRKQSYSGWQFAGVVVLPARTTMRSHGLGWLPSVSLATWLRGCQAPACPFARLPAGEAAAHKPPKRPIGQQPDILRSNQLSYKATNPTTLQPGRQQIIEIESS